MVKNDTTKKIAYLANTRFPSERAHAVQISHMCNAFVVNNNQVDLFINKRCSESIEQIEDWFGQSMQFDVKRLAPSWFFASPRIFFYLSEFVFAFAFIFSGRREKYDVIYSRHEWVLYFLSFIISADKLVWESHEAKLNHAARSLLKGKVKTAVISDGIYEDYVVYGVDKKQLHIAYDAVDDSFFASLETKEQARRRLGLPQEKRIVMYIGGLDTWKGAGVFCEASQGLDDVSFVVIGGKADQITQLQNKYPDVTFLGQQPYKELPNNQQAADILVIPNTAKTDLSARYTSPLKLFAHMTSGVPIIASDVPSITTVTGSESVTLFTPDDGVALAKACTEVLCNYTVKQKVAQELQIVSEKYSWNNRALEIIEFIRV